MEILSIAMAFLAGSGITLFFSVKHFGKQVGKLAVKLAEEQIVPEYQSQIDKQNEIIEKVAATTAAQIQEYMEQWSNAYNN